MANNKEKRLDFYSVNDLLEYIKNVPADNRSKRDPGNSWNGASFDDAVKMIKSGWPEGTKEVDVKADQINQSQAVPNNYNWEVQGDMFDVGVFLTGQPECWLEPVMVEKPKKELKLAINCTVNSRINQEYFYNRGAVIAALVDQLYKTHFIEILFYIRSENTWGNANTTVVLHVNTKNLYSRDLITYLTAHISFLRRLFFAVAETLFQVPACGYYGQARDYELFENGEYIHFSKLENNSGAFRTMESSIKYFNELTAKIGGQDADNN